MARPSFARGSKIQPAWPLGLSISKLVLVLFTGVALTGCSGGPATTATREAPPLNLAKTSREALGGPSRPGDASAAPVYDYRGGRDPVTGNAGAVATSAAPADASTGAPKIIEIRKGDTLHGLSLTHHVSVKALMAANNLTSAAIRPGQKLLLPEG